MNWETLTDAKKCGIRELSEQSLLFYSRAMFRFQEGSPFFVNWHHRLICDELEAVERLETENLVINIAPGGSKTHLVSVCFPSRGFIKNRISRFLTVSYSAELVKDISTRIKDMVVDGDEFQELWPIEVARDSSEKSHWKILDERGKKSGEYKCASSGGSITGFRAGRLSQDKFYGSLILDDPNKPADMLTDKKRENSNRIWETTRTRYASPRTPTVLVQQRLHTLDATGYKLSRMKCIEDGTWYRVYQSKPGAPKWRQIIIPALITDEYVASLPEKYRRYVTGPLYGTDEHGRYSYWPEKETLEGLLDIESTSPYMFKAQYMQDPVPLGGKIFPPSVWKYYNAVTAPKFEWRFITGDTALKAKETSDYSVFVEWGVAKGELYLIDYIRGKWESPALKVRLLSMVAKANSKDVDRLGKLRGVWVEDAVSGVGLIADTRHVSPVPINPYKPNKLGKNASAQDTLPYLETPDSIGRVYLPEDMNDKLLTDWVAEHAAFTFDDSHANDDMCDNTFMGVAIGLRHEMLSGNTTEMLGASGTTGKHDF